MVKVKTEKKIENKNEGGKMRGRRRICFIGCVTGVLRNSTGKVSYQPGLPAV
jgi:hypothetical protein